MEPQCAEEKREHCKLNERQGAENGTLGMRRRRNENKQEEKWKVLEQVYGGTRVLFSGRRWREPGEKPYVARGSTHKILSRWCGFDSSSSTVAAAAPPGSSWVELDKDIPFLGGSGVKGDGGVHGNEGIHFS